jgi:hypothetical protein
VQHILPCTYWFLGNADGERRFWISQIDPLYGTVRRDDLSPADGRRRFRRDLEQTGEAVFRGTATFEGKALASAAVIGHLQPVKQRRPPLL